MRWRIKGIDYSLIDNVKSKSLNKEYILSDANINQINESNLHINAKYKFTKEEEERQFRENLKVLEDEMQYIIASTQNEISDLQAKHDDIISNSEKESEQIKQRTTQENERLTNER